MKRSLELTDDDAELIVAALFEHASNHKIVSSEKTALNLARNRRARAHELAHVVRCAS